MTHFHVARLSRSTRMEEQRSNTNLRLPGGAKKQYQFAFTSREEYDKDARINIENSGFFQSFDEWLEKKTDAEELPELEEGKSPVRIETLNSGYLYDVDEDKARYRIECRLIYVQEA